MTTQRTARLFVASPGDVGPERLRLQYIADRLSDEPGAPIRFEVVRWEERHYRANRGFQEQIPEPASCDIVVVVFGNELGTPLDGDFKHRMPGGQPYPSGTAYELLSAIDAADASGKGVPDVFVYRKAAVQAYTVDEDDAYDRARAARKRLDAFLQHSFRTGSGGWRRSYVPVVSTDDFGARVESMLRAWVREQGAEALDLRWRIDQQGSPFRGLETFDARHAAVFFGRNQKVQTATAALVEAGNSPARHPFLLVVGPSGAGKSSLVRAGVVPRVTMPGAVPGIDAWRVAVMRPGAAATPFDSLATALFRDGSPDQDPGGFGPALPELAQGLYADPATLATALRLDADVRAAPIIAALDTAAAAEARRRGIEHPFRTDLVLLVDQLDEVFAADVPEPERRDFGRLLLALVRSRRVWIIATLRADLVARMIADPVFLALADRGAEYKLASPGEAELREILGDSAAAAGLAYDNDPELGRTLDEQLLLDASGADALPLLQFALKQLFEKRETLDPATGAVARLTFAAYRGFGGLDGAIDSVGEQAIASAARELGEATIETALPRMLRRMAAAVQEDAGALAGTMALTLRGATLDHAAPDAPSRRLAGMLVDARLLVTDRGPGGGMLRVAHERVMTSWRRARAVATGQRDFFRIARDVERQRQRWADGAERRELLLEEGAPIQDAQRVLRDFGDDLSPATRDYVGLSLRRARWSRRRRRAAIATLCATAMVATVAAFLARSVGERSERNFEAARGAADQLVAALPQQLRNQQNVSFLTVDTVLHVVDTLLTTIETQLAAPQGVVQHQVEAVAARMGGLFPGAGAAAASLARIRRNRADMLYEFAETYHQAADNLARAQDAAERSLALYTALRDEGDVSPGLAWRLHLVRMALADLLRDALRRPPPPRPPPPQAYAGVMQHLTLAHDIARDLVARAPENLAFAAGLSKAVTRQGDVLMLQNDPAAAERAYAELQSLALAAYRRAPDDIPTLRELGWSYRKRGEALARPGPSAPALIEFGRELCLRRDVLRRKGDDRLLDEDLGFSLAKLAEERARLGDLQGARIAYSVALDRRTALADGDSSSRNYAETAALAIERLRDLFDRMGDRQRAFDFAAAAAERRTGIARKWTDPRSADSLAAAQTRLKSLSDPPLTPTASFEQERAWATSHAAPALDEWAAACTAELSPYGGP